MAERQVPQEWDLLSRSAEAKVLLSTTSLVPHISQAGVIMKDIYLIKDRHNHI